MRVLIACEFSGIVRNAFAARGHDAWSCDLLPSESEGLHFQDDVLDRLAWMPWDLMIAHPPCTFLANSGVRWLYQKSDKGTQPVAERWDLMVKAAGFFKQLLEANILRICIENPIIHKHARNIIGRNYDQLVQPWQFGHGETKATCLWLKNLPTLKSTNIVSGRRPRVHFASPSPDRWKDRSRTLQGIANAMADQWGG